MKRIILGLLIGLGLTAAVTYAAIGGTRVNQGGTGQTAISEGAVFYGSSTNQSLNILGPCSDGQIMKWNSSGIPSCSADSTGSSATTTINGFSGPAFTFATSSVPGLNFVITGSGSTITFAPAYATGYSIPLNASTTEWELALQTKLSTTTAAGTYEPILTKGNLTATSPLQFNNTRQVIGGAAEVSVASGYGIPLTASTTEWTNFYNTPSTRITAGNNLSWSGNTLNGTMASSTIIAGGTATHNPSVTFSTSTDTNILLNIVCATSTCTFNPSWTGTLADDRITSAATWNSKQAGDADLTQIAGFAKTKGNLIVADGSDWQVLGVGANGTVLTASSTAANGAVWAAAGGSGTVTSVDMSVPTGLSVSGNPITTSGTLALSLTSGYVIPLSASTTEWALALQTKLSTTTAASTYEPILTKGNLTENITGLEFDQTRQVIGGAAALSLTSGYTIPLSASTTEWSTAYGWGNHAGLYPTFGYASSSYATLWNLKAGTNITIATSSGVTISATSPTILAGGTATGPAFTIATSTDTNLGIRAVCASATCTFTPQWIGTLASSRLTGTDIATVGTITSGTWNGTVIAPTYGGTGTTTAPTTQGQILAADSTGTKYGPTTLVAGSNITITTTTPGRITLAASSGGLSGGTNGYVARWTAADALSSGILLDNGTVAGVNATSSSYAFNIQGTGSVHPLQVGTSTNASMLVVRGDSGNVGIGTTSPGSKLEVSGGNVLLGNNTAYQFRDSNGVARNAVSLTSANNLQIGGTNGAVAGSLSIVADNNISLQPGSSAGSNTTMFLQYNGNVGIGTTSPSQLLTVGAANNFTVSSAGNILSGVWNGTAIDIGSYTNLAAGRSLTLSGDSVEADAELYTHTKNFSFRASSGVLSATTSVAQLALPTNSTITLVYCSTNANGATIQLDERATSTPNTAGTDVMTSALNCTSSGAQTTSFANAGILAEVPINIDVDLASSTVTRISGFIKYTTDD